MIILKKIQVIPLRGFVLAIMLVLIPSLNLVAAPMSGLRGTVKDSAGRPLKGAMVSLGDATTRITVFTNRSGAFRISTKLTGKLLLRVRRHPFRDLYQDLDFSQRNNRSVAVTLQPYKNPEKFSNSLPASSHVIRLQWPEEELKSEFKSQCQYCHQMGNALTRKKRSRENWETVIERMEGMGALITFHAGDTFPEILSRDFNDTPHKTDLLAIDPEPLYNTRFQEWTMGEGRSYVHDIEIFENGKLYGVDMSLDQMIEVHPDTNQIQVWDFPESDLPLGGYFSGAYRPLGSFDAYHGPHSIQTDRKGLLWTTNSLACELMSFNPEKEEFKLYPLPEGYYPHTLRINERGQIWFTMALSNQVAMFDPATGKYTFIDLPTHSFTQWLTNNFLGSLLWISSLFPAQNLQVSLSPHKITGAGHKMFALPYGIDFDPRDGSIWYGKLYSGHIGRIDPKTHEVEEFKSPLPGPRRMRFSKDGALWIPSFGGSALMKFDTKTKKFAKIYKLPLRGPGEYEMPYALNIHPRTQEVWITGGLSDRLIRFNPRTETFTTYPLPTRVTFMREIVFTEDGRICSSYSNVPAYSIEGGKPKIFCLKTSDSTKRTIKDKE